MLETRHLVLVLAEPVVKPPPLIADTKLGIRVAYFLQRDKGLFTTAANVSETRHLGLVRPSLTRDETSAAPTQQNEETNTPSSQLRFQPCKGTNIY